MEKRKAKVKIKIGSAYIYGWESMTSQLSSAYIFEVSSIEELLNKIQSCGFNPCKDEQRIAIIDANTDEIITENILAGDIVRLDFKGFRQYLKDNNIENFYFEKRYEKLGVSENLKVERDCHINKFNLFNVNGFIISCLFVKKLKEGKCLV